QRARHVTAYLQPGNPRHWFLFARFVGGPLQPADPGRLERYAIRSDRTGAESWLDNLFQFPWGEKRAREEIGMRERGGRNPGGNCLAPCIGRTAASSKRGNQQFRQFPCNGRHKPSGANQSCHARRVRKRLISGKKFIAA